MESYLLKFSACLLVFWLVYVLLLERQKMHQLKRIYLLGAVVLALVIPLLTITYYVEPVVPDFEVSQAYIPIEPIYKVVEATTPPFWNLEKILWIIYGIGVLVFFGRFVINLFRMYKRISGHDKVSERSFIYVLLQELRIPHSFFKYIFLNQSKYEAESIPKEVMLHEETHAKQLHSIDILVIELLQIVFWFHPLIYILKHHIKLNHEFLADQAVLQEGVDTKTYQNILLQFSSNTDEYQLSSAINYSSIKKRFTVMKTNTSKTRIWISSLLLLPIIAILFYSFAEKEYVEKEIIENSEVLQIENHTTNEGATEAMMKEYKDWIKKLNNKSPGLFIPVGTWERLVAIYDLMSEAQRNSVEKHPILQEITPELYSVEPSTPTAVQFESWKNEKEFAIWLDNKHISNSELNNYKINDIAHFVGSKAHSNARSEKFPQPFQFRLYTNDGFNKFYTEAYVSGYKEICNEYSIAIHDYLKGSQTDNSELRIIKAQADKFYNQFTKAELKKHNILPAPPVPAQKNSDNKDELVKFLEKEINQKNSKTITVLINRKDQFLINDELGSYESLEALLKKLSEPELYKAKFKADKETSKELIHRTLGLLINYRITIPYKLDEEPQEYAYNPSFLDYIIEMEKEGATFYLDDVKITAEKAKSIATSNKGKRTEMTTQLDTEGKYMVKLSSAEKQKVYARSIDLKILNDGSYLIDEIKATKSTFKNVFNQLHQDITPEIRNKIMNIHITSSKVISNEETWFIYNSLQDYGFYRIVTPNQVINRAKDNTPFAIESHISSQQKLPTNKEVATYNAWAKKIHSKSKKLSSDATWYPPIDEQKFIKFTEIYNRMSQRQKNQSVEYPFPGLEAKASEQQGATKKQIAEYNKLANHCNSQLKREFPIIKVKDVKRIEYLYSKMSEDQKKNAKSYPDFSKVPPPPPRPVVIEEEREIPAQPPIPKNASPEEIKRMKKVIEDYKKKHPESVTRTTQIGEVIEIVEMPRDQEGKTKIAGKEYFYKIKDGETTYYDRHGNKVDINRMPPPPPPTKAPQYNNGKKKTLNEIIKETPKGVESGYELLENGESHYYTVYKDQKTHYNKDGFITDEKGNVLPPPPPTPPALESTLDFVIRMAKANAKFFYKLKPISSDKAIDILKKKPNTHINAQKTDTKEPLVYMSNKPILIGVKEKSKN